LGLLTAVLLGCVVHLWLQFYIHFWVFGVIYGWVLFFELRFVFCLTLLSELWGLGSSVSFVAISQGGVLPAVAFDRFFEATLFLVLSCDTLFVAVLGLWLGGSSSRLWDCTCLLRWLRLAVSSLFHVVMLRPCTLLSASWDNMRLILLAAASCTPFSPGWLACG
jgi:hypothetical protein